jgi:hypothetical protein
MKPQTGANEAREEAGAEDERGDRRIPPASAATVKWRRGHAGRCGDPQEEAQAPGTTALRREPRRRTSAIAEA